jgi:hypothetical protein
VSLDGRPFRTPVLHPDPSYKLGEVRDIFKGLLQLSTKTVANDHTLIRQKLGVNSDAEPVHLALRNGLLRVRSTGGGPLWCDSGRIAARISFALPRSPWPPQRLPPCPTSAS